MKARKQIKGSPGCFLPRLPSNESLKTKQGQAWGRLTDTGVQELGKKDALARVTSPGRGGDSSGLLCTLPADGWVVLSLSPPTVPKVLASLGHKVTVCFPELPAAA